MKKRRGLKVAIAIVLTLSILLGAGFAGLSIAAAATNKEFVSDRTLEEQLEALTEAHEEVTVDEDGMVFINNEIIVLAAAEATREDMDALAQEYKAEISDAMEDIGVYQFHLAEGKELKKLQKIAKEIAAEEPVDSAYITPVSLAEDDAGEEEDSAPDPVYPSDPWKNAKWSTKAPRDANWSVEAIRAPQAWGYLDQLETVNIGLIDSMVNTDHEDLNVSGAYASYYDLDTGTWATYTVDAGSLPPQDHGTHVAGTMAATWNDVGMSGIMADKGRLYYSMAYNTRNGSVTNVFYTPYTYVKAISVLLEQDVQAINISQNTNRLIGFAASHGNKNAKQYLESQAELAEAMLLRIIQNRQAKNLPDFVICVAAGNSNATTYYPSETATYGYTETPSAWQRVNGGGEKGGSLAIYNNYLNLIEGEEVLSRIIVVGAAGIDHRNSTGTETRYSYAEFSNVGDRVDITAPGVAVYSCTKKSHDYMNGTSMATPHVTAAAGLVFGANPDLTGPEVKAIVCASTYGRFTYEGGESGMLDLSVAVSKGLLTIEKSVNQVVSSGTGSSGLDLCFVVDTTGSMGDDIDNAKENMKQILDTLGEKTEDYRVAVVDYRDFPDRGGSEDYAAKVQLKFTDDRDAITGAIDGLDLGYGGDYEETVYSGIAAALTLDWRKGASKAIIILGDAPALDPEPHTGYTYDIILKALQEAEIAVGLPSDEEATPVAYAIPAAAEDSASESIKPTTKPVDSEVKVYSIVPGSGAADFFEQLSTETGGSSTNIDDASQVADAIQSSIEMIELEPVQTVKADFGKDFSGEIVELYLDNQYQFSVKLDEEGKVTLQDMPIDKFEYEISRLHRTGSLTVREGKKAAKLDHDDAPWYGFLLVIWARERTVAFWCIEGTLLLTLVVLITVNVILSRREKLGIVRVKKEKAPKPPKKAKTDPMAATAEVPMPQEPPVMAEPPVVMEPPVVVIPEPDTSAPVPEELPLVEPPLVIEEPAPVQTAFCPNCGAPTPAGSLFCSECGHRLG